MVDFIPSIRTALETATGLTCYIELFEEPASSPCLTIIQSSCSDRTVGDNIKYSYPVYTIKVYDDSYSNLVTNIEKVDTAMFQLGYKLDGSNILKYDNHFCKVLNYGWLVKEKFQ